MGILEFNSILAKDLVGNYFAQTPESERAKVIDVDDFSISRNQQTPVNAAANVLKEISTMDEYKVSSALTFFSNSNLIAPHLSLLKNERFQFWENTNSIPMMNRLITTSMKWGR